MEQLPSSAFRASSVPAGGIGVRPAAFDPRMKPIYIGLALGWAVLLIALPLANIWVDPILTAAFLLVCGLCVWTAACLRLRGFARTATAIEAWALFSAMCLGGILGTYLAARYAAPFADTWMASADRIIAPGLDWSHTMLTVASHPLLMRCANQAYATLQWQSGVLIILSCATGHTDRCAPFLLRWLIALALCTAIFALLPCNGPYAFYAIPQAAMPNIGSAIGWRQPELLAWLRSAGALRVDPSTLDGIVEFPSFHAAGATLFIWGFWSIRWARWPMLVLNLAMIAAAAPVGGHYYADLLGGILIAGISIVLPGLAAKGAVALRRTNLRPSLQ